MLFSSPASITKQPMLCHDYQQKELINRPQRRPLRHVCARNRRHQTSMFDLRNEGHHRHLYAGQVGTNWIQERNRRKIFQCSKQRRFLPTGRQTNNPEQEKSFTEKRRVYCEARIVRWSSTEAISTVGGTSHVLPLTLSSLSRSPLTAALVRHHVQGLLLVEHGTECVPHRERQSQLCK